MEEYENSDSLSCVNFKYRRTLQIGKIFYCDTLECEETLMVQANDNDD